MARGVLTVLAGLHDARHDAVLLFVETVEPLGEDATTMPQLASCSSCRIVAATA